MVEQPIDFAARKVSVNYQAGFAANQAAMTGPFQLIAKVGSAAILPNNSVVNGVSGSAIPDHRGFTLIGHTDGGNISCFQSGFSQHFSGDSQLAGPNLERIVLDPSGLGKNLPKLLLSNGTNRPAMFKKDCTRAGCALVQCQNYRHINCDLKSNGCAC